MLMCSGFAVRWLLGLSGWLLMFSGWWLGGC